MSTDDDRADTLSERHVRTARERGRITDEEAAALTNAADSKTRTSVMQSIRVRHAAEQLTSAVEAGTISSAEAERLLAQVRTGGHIPGLRRRINQLTRRAKDPQR